MLRKVFLLILVLSSISSFAYAQPEAESVPFSYYGTRGRGPTAIEIQSPYSLNYLLETVTTPVEVDQDSFAYKFGNGAINTTTSWTDLPKEIGRVSQEQNILAGCTLGFGEGIISGIIRGFAGIYEMATFALPPYDEPLMEPEYKVDQPEEEFKITLIRW